MIENNSQQEDANPYDENSDPHTAGAQAKSNHPVWEIVKFFILAIIIVIPIRIYIAQPFIVSGASMDPTFASGQYLIIDELTYRLEKPERGDVIVLRYPKKPSTFFIKRIIGLPGDTLTISNGQISITRDGWDEPLVLDEPYITFPKTDSADDRTITLSEGKFDTVPEYYVMGDNRAKSSDSRVWGTLPESMIVGRALVRLFPFDQIDLFPGGVSPYENAKI